MVRGEEGAIGGERRGVSIGSGPRKKSVRLHAFLRGVAFPRPYYALWRGRAGSSCVGEGAALRDGGGGGPD